MTSVSSVGFIPAAILTEPNALLDALPYKESNTPHWCLEGFHQRSGQWIKLAKFSTESPARDAIKLCHSKTQPVRHSLVITFEDFSAFKIDSYVTLNMYRGGTA